MKTDTIEQSVSSNGPYSGAQTAHDVALPSQGGTQIINRLVSPTPTPVYDTYWRFACERQRIFYARLNGQQQPWTSDPVLAEYKFTNAYRASDRVSQYLIKEVIYAGNYSPSEIFFRVLLFKLFNQIETWEMLSRECGDITFGDYSFARYDEVLSAAMARGDRIYSAAYIMAATKETGAKKHQMHLRLLEKMMVDRVPERLQETRSMEEAYRLLRERPMLGDFLAYQYLVDLNYSPLLSFSEMDFVMPGPGALDGIRKCFSDLGGRTPADIIRFVAERQDDEFAKRGLSFLSLWGRSLQLIDCQNLFCEVDKYSRVAHPEYSGRSGRTKIKQRFDPDHKPISYWYPPKWGLNSLIR